MRKERENWAKWTGLVFDSKDERTGWWKWVTKYGISEGTIYVKYNVFCLGLGGASTDLNTWAR